MQGMKPRISFLLSPVSSLAARLRRSRPGSVLIIVIVLLLLLAILGSAFISTTRSSRVASAQNVLSTDVDTALNGIAEVCQGVIADDLNDTFGDLYGNTAYTTNTTIVNRSCYQGETGPTAVGSGPPTAPNVPSYSPGDIGNDVSNPTVFYGIPQGASASLGSIPNPLPANSWQPLNGHLPITACGSDPWLADRVPDPAGTGSPVWQYLTQSIQVSAGTPYSASILGTPFEDPLTGTAPVVLSPLLGAPTPLTPTFNTLLNGYDVPALQNGAGAKFTAADADGDGIADSLLFRIPGLNLDGLTWYAGVRIIDNNSAINANTAWSRDTDYQWYTGSPPTLTSPPTAGPNAWAAFQMGVGLQELINTGDIPGYVVGSPNLNALNAYRFNQSTGIPTAGYNPFDETPISNVPPQAFDRGKPPVNASATNNTTDYNFVSEGEAYYQQFIRRIANPGYNTYSGGSPPVGARYQALPLSDEAALAYHFCLQNPNSLSQSVIESLLPNSLCGTALSPVPSTPYDPSQVNTPTTGWYPANFKYTALAADAVVAPMSLRAVLVTHSPVSNYIQQIYNNNGGTASTSDPILPNYMLPYSGATNLHYKGEWSDRASYNVNDIVVFPGPTPPTSVYASGLYTGPSYTFIAVNPSTGQQPATINANNILTVVTSGYWQLQPWSTNPVKANVNTATFRELFRAFWCVMAGNPSSATPFGYYAVANEPPSIYGDTGPVTATANPQHEFRSSLRDPTNNTFAGATQLDPPPGTTNAGGLNGFTQLNGGGGATNTNTMLLRAASAAVNTLGLRDNSQNIISKTFIVNNAYVPSVSNTTGTPVEIRVFSNAPQPFITEVYVDNYNGTPPAAAGGAPANPNGYIAIELFNPYSVSITLTNWQLAYINRPTGAVTPAVYPNLTLMPVPLTPVTPLPTITIQPHSYVVLENYNGAGAGGTDANYRSTNSGLYPPTGPLLGYWSGTGPPPTALTLNGDQYVPGLSVVYGGILGASSTDANGPLNAGGELVLLRPRRYDGVYVNYTDPANPGVGGESFNESSKTPTDPTFPNLYDLVPVDSYDFTGFPAPTAGQWTAWSYIRAKGPGNLFDATYPGVYDAGQTFLKPKRPRQNGTATAVIASVANAAGYPSSLPWSTANAIPSFFQTVTSSYLYYQNNYLSTNPPPPPSVQIYNLASGNAGGDVMHFPNSVISPQHPTGIGTPNLFPLGGFARNGDMLDIPFIGAYRVRMLSGNPVAGYALAQSGPTAFLELNALPTDCGCAAVDDQSTTSKMTLGQNIGRFVPMAASYSYVTQLQTTRNLPDYYAWTRNLFNYLTVQSSTDAYLPNIDPNVSSSNTGAAMFAYPPQNNGTPLIPPTPALTGSATATDQTTQDNVGIEGLININTASWKVLSMLPFVPNNPGVNRQIAQNIVNYRLTNGPFMSIFDLNQVPGFQNETGAVGPISAAPSSGTGLVSPADAGFETSSPSAAATGVSEDYQWDCLTLDRISNLITTRSDTFTIYVVLQGWQNVGTANAQPMVTRRFAYIVDRSAVNADPTTRFLKTLTVPND